MSGLLWRGIKKEKKMPDSINSHVQDVLATLAADRTPPNFDLTPREVGLEPFNRTLEIAQKYVSLGYSVVPVPYRRKECFLPDWTSQRLQPNELPDHFGQKPMNIGIILGDASGGLGDADLDCPEACALATDFLPPTDCKFGHASKAASHWIYRIQDDGPSQMFRDPAAKGDAMLLEYRSNGLQTVFPGSIHPSGEPITFDSDGQPSCCSRESLIHAMERLATCCLLVRRWTEGIRHQATLPLAGCLLGAGFTKPEAEHFVRCICRTAADTEVADRLRAVETTWAQHANGRPIQSWSAFAEVFDRTTADAVRRWLSHASIGHRESLPEPNVPKFGLLSDLPFSDAGIAEHFVKRMGADVRYCFTRQRWVIWGGKKWAVDRTDQILELGTSCVRELYKSLSVGLDDVDASQKLRKFLKAYLDAPGLTRMLSLARPKCAAQSNEFDTKPWLLNCDNGTVDLKTGALQEHRRDDRLTKTIGIPYDQSATCPAFVKFLNDVMDGDQTMVDYLQRVIGYSLTGDTSEDCLFILHGAGANGKSTLLDTLQTLLGPFSAQVQSESFMIQKTQTVRSDIARLDGARFAVSSESEKGHRFAESLIKQLTGGDKVTARQLYSAEFEYKPQFKIFLGTNKRPDIKGTDNGIWRRIHLVPFDVTFAGEKQDKGLREKLKAELPGILAWAVRGCLAWQEAGGLRPPTKVTGAVSSYRSDMDSLQRFLDERCVIEADAILAKKDLYDAYVLWCELEGDGPMTKSLFAQGLKEHGFREKRTSTARQWSGLRLVKLADAVSE
jgi:putative DNA primase/helicase